MAKFLKEVNRKTNTNFYIYNSKDINEAEIIGLEKKGVFIESVPQDKKIGIVAQSINGKNVHFKSEESLVNVKLEGKKTEKGFYFTYKKV